VDVEADVVVIGSGMGGSVVAYGLAQQGIDVAVIEQGTFLPQEAENWDADAVFGQARYKPHEQWWDANNKVAFKPGVHYVVGGNTKVFGASLPRFREKDFEEFEQAEGTSPAWPFSYADIEPWYGRAETLFGVHGTPRQARQGPQGRGASPLTVGDGCGPSRRRTVPEM
jgi:choline dehydrogenase-like flavoprotein